MKTYTILLITIFSLAAIGSTNQVQAQPGFSTNINFNTFYDQLSPYGQWLNVPRFGRVWSYNEPGFRPYATNGQWEDTDQGWYWNSNYEWGAIPFHYGRWELDPYYGWIWIPGYDYAPAWVVWSQTSDCYGWAPLGFGLDINVSFGRIPSNRWMYAPVANITRPRIDRYCIPYERNTFYYQRQQPIVNVYAQRNVRYMAGPRRDDHYQNSHGEEHYQDNHYQPQRPQVRNEQNGNRRGYYDNANGPQRNNDYSDNNRNRAGNNIHFDPATQYDHARTIAAGRPPVLPDTRQRGQDMRSETRQQPSPQISHRDPRPQVGESRANSQPQVREMPQPQRNPGGEGSRPFGRDRRIS